MMRSMLLLACSVVLFSLGCSEKPGGPVATELDQQAINDYQAQADGDGYENYVEPK